MTIKGKKKSDSVLMCLAITTMILMIVFVLFAGTFLKLNETKHSGLNAIVKAEEIIKKGVENIVFVASIPSATNDTYEFNGRTYKIFAQFSRNYTGYNEFLAAHGCMATSMTTILRAYVPECASWTPYETIAIAEKQIAGEEAHTKNYNKTNYYQRPMSSYGATKVLDAYGIAYKYEKQLGSDECLKDDLRNHLKTGKPVLFTVSRYNRKTKEYSSKWTSSFHTMIMIGIDKEDNVLIGNPGSSQRFHLVELEEMTNYMWSCYEEPDSFYWNNIKKCGGYIKIME